MATDIQMLALVGKIYSALQDSDWTPFLEQFRDRVGGETAALFHHNTQTHSGGNIAVIGVDPMISKQYDDYYHRVDPWGVRGKNNLRTGNVLLSQSLITEKEFQETEFYQDFLKKTGLFNQFFGVIERRDTFLTGIASLRSRRAGEYTLQEQNALNVLMPHLRQALSLHEHIQGLQRQSASINAALDQIRLGILLLDSQERIRFANRRAESILARNDGISIKAGSIHLRLANEHSLLRRLIGRARQTADNWAPTGGGAMTISRPSGKPSFLAWIIPVMPDTMLWCFQRSALIAIMIADGEFSTELNNHPDLVRQLGFTHAEAKLADLLVQGKSLTEASDELGVTRNTVRSQLAQLFIKTDTHRQGELLRVLLQTTIVGQ